MIGQRFSPILKKNRGSNILINRIFHTSEQINSSVIID